MGFGNPMSTAAARTTRENRALNRSAIALHSICGLALFGCNKQSGPEPGFVESPVLAKVQSLPDLVSIVGFLFEGLS